MNIVFFLKVIFGKELTVFGKYSFLFFSVIKNASAILQRMRFSETEQGILGSDVFFLGEN